MTQEDKQLLLVDLCGRLPYGVICRFTDTFDGCEVDNVLHPDDITDMFRHRSHCDSRIDVKPYLRQMSSMTEEEMKEYGKVCELDTEILANHPMNGEPFPALYNSQDWLNRKMFDYRGLIPKGIALSTEVFNPFKD